jgi:hypothetical protein
MNVDREQRRQIQTMYEQTEYGLAYALVAAVLLLGILAVCIPRPRNRNLEEEAKKRKKRRRV